MIARKPKRASLDLNRLLEQSAAGVQISGDSGTGKSNFMAELFCSVIKSGHGATLIDPDGDLAGLIEGICSALPRRVRDRVIIVKPCDTRRTVGINPLVVRGGRSDLHSYRARRTTKVSHFRKILFAAWGEAEQGIKGRPQLAKFSDLYLNTLAECRLTVPDIRCFFDVTSPVYQGIIRRAPDLLSQMELLALADLRPKDREEIIASTKNRFYGFLQNPIVDTLLGNVRPDQLLDYGRLIQERAIVIVNLERGGMLRDEDVEIFANLFLHEIIFAVINTPQERRILHTIFLDELPDFESSTQLLCWSLRHGRKFRTRFVSAHQGTQFFEDRTESRLLHALVGQCRTHYYFRHADPVDAKFFGEIIRLPSLDPKRIKHVLTQEQQYQDGHDLLVLEDESENWSAGDSQGTSDAQAMSNTITDTAGTSQSIRTMAAAADAASQEVNANSSSRSEAGGTTQTTTTNRSTTNSRGGGKTRRQTLVARIKTRTIITSVQFYPLDEQNMEGAVEIVRQPIGAAIEYVSGQTARQVKFPLARNPLAGTPKFARKKHSEFDQLLSQRPEYARPAEVQADRQLFVERLVEHLEVIPVEHHPLDEPRRIEESPPASPFEI